MEDTTPGTENDADPTVVSPACCVSDAPVTIETPEKYNVIYT